MSLSAHSQDYRESEVGALRDALRQTKSELLAREREVNDLRQSVAECRQAAAELHHRLRNSFQLLDCALRLQERAVTDADAAAAIAKARCRIIAVAQVHNSLDADRQAGTVFSGDYFNDLCQAIAKSLDLRCAVSAENFAVEIGLATSFGIILNELVINAAKHACAGDDGEPAIRVQFCREDGHARLMVADKGPGLPDDFDLATAKSLGMKIIHSTAAQIGGSVQIERDDGATITVTAPLGRPVAPNVGVSGRA